MKRLLLIPLLLVSLVAGATKEVLVESGKLTTAPGIGGDAQVGFAFAKGDKITISATASKVLDRMLVLMDPATELGRVRHSKNPGFTFTMPADGIVVFRFISDRDGTNNIGYTVRRMPASDAVQSYNTKVIWKNPPAGAKGNQIPVRADE
jgi:hypothetical protein